MLLKASVNFFGKPRRPLALWHCLNQRRGQAMTGSPLLATSVPKRLFASSFGQDFDPNKDYWQVLGVRKGAPEKEVKIAYYKMAQKYHPDKTEGKTTEKFKEIQNAYEVLSDSGKRSQWEAARSQSQRGGPGGFGSGFGQGAAQGQYERQGQQQQYQQYKRKGQREEEFFNDFFGFRQHQQQRRNPYGHEQANSQQNEGHQGQQGQGQGQGQKQQQQTYRKTTYKDAKGNTYTFYDSGNFQSQQDFQRQAEDFFRNHGTKKNASGTDPFSQFQKNMEEMYQRQQAATREREEFYRERYGDPNYENAKQNARAQYERHQERERAPHEDPFNTPFENWYADQKRDPFSQINLMGRYIRIFLWMWLGFLTLKMLGLVKGRGQQKREAEDAYFREMEMERLHNIALQQQQVVSQHGYRQGQGQAPLGFQPGVHLTPEEFERERRQREWQQRQYQR